MAATLLVLAAGMGSRYGGLKQLDPVGPSGETILDYAVFDAIRAGFGRVVFVIRRDFEAEFRQKVGAKYAGRIALDYVFQALDELPSGQRLPPGREKPWGTGHAVWCARRAVKEPFAVIGADDFFGRDAFVQLGRFLERRSSGGSAPGPAAGVGPAAYAMVGYRLENTLSEHGSVSRGVCAVGAGGSLQKVVEHTGIKRDEVGPGRRYSGDETVSMNCWAFSASLFPALDRQFSAFFDEVVPANPLKAEFFLPEAVSAQIGAGEATVEVLPTTASWFGVTYREDKPRVQAALAARVAEGEYPASLF